MSDIPFLFTVAVIVNQEGEITGLFQTVSTSERIQERCRESETVLGVFPVCSSMTAMSFFFADSAEARLCQSIAVSFFEAGYRAGVKKSEK